MAEGHEFGEKGARLSVADKPPAAAAGFAASLNVASDRISGGIPLHQRSSLHQPCRGDPVTLLDAVHHIHPLNHPSENGITAVKLRQGLQGHIELGTGRIGIGGTGHGHGSAFMGETEVAGLDRRADRRAVTEFRFTLEGELQGDEAGLPRGGIHKAAGAELAHGGSGVGAQGITALHHEGNGLTHHAVKDRAVVGAPVDEIHEIARGEGGILSIEPDAHLTLVGLQGDQGSATETRHAGGSAAERLAPGVGGTGAQSEGQQQQPETGQGTAEQGQKGRHGKR